MKRMLTITLPLLMFAACEGDQTRKQKDIIAIMSNANAPIVSDKDISDAYAYLLGREAVLKQMRVDFEKDSFTWNNLIHRTPEAVNSANPDLEVAYSEAWVAVDEKTCVLLEIPAITDRYYTLQMLNGWGETILNINERTYPHQPFGKYALCLAGSNPQIPAGALRVELPCKISRVLARIELGADVHETKMLQHSFKLEAQGKPMVDQRIEVPFFEGLKLPGAEMFENATIKMASEKDNNPDMESLQAKVKVVEAYVRSGDEGRDHVDEVIREVAIPRVMSKIQNMGVFRNGWQHPLDIGSYGKDYLMRTAVNLNGVWMNNIQETSYYTNQDLNGSNTYLLTFPPNALPTKKSEYFWSVVAVDAIRNQVLPNPLKRYLLNENSGLAYNPDGSLTLVFSPMQPDKYPESNWLPTVEGVRYNLSFRFYGPTKDVRNGQYFLPPLILHNREVVIRQIRRINYNRKIDLTLLLPPVRCIAEENRIAKKNT